MVLLLHLLLAGVVLQLHSSGGSAGAGRFLWSSHTAGVSAGAIEHWGQAGLAVSLSGFSSFSGLA